MDKPEVIQPGIEPSSVCGKLLRDHVPATAVAVVSFNLGEKCKIKNVHFKEYILVSGFRNCILEGKNGN